MWETKKRNERSKRGQRERCMLEALGVTQAHTDIERGLNDLVCVRHRASCKCPLTVYCADGHDGSTSADFIFSGTGATM